MRGTAHGNHPFFQIWLIYDKTAWKPTRYKLGFIRESPRFSFARLYSGPASTSGIHHRQSSLPAPEPSSLPRAPHVLTASGQMRGCGRADTLGTAKLKKALPPPCPGADTADMMKTVAIQRIDGDPLRSDIGPYIIVRPIYDRVADPFRLYLQFSNRRRVSVLSLLIMTFLLISCGTLSWFP